MYVHLVAKETIFFVNKKKLFHANSALKNSNQFHRIGKLVYVCVQIYL